MNEDPGRNGHWFATPPATAGTFMVARGRSRDPGTTDEQLERALWNPATRTAVIGGTAFPYERHWLWCMAPDAAE